jgi:AraC-like DNA-binding protein
MEILKSPHCDSLISTPLLSFSQSGFVTTDESWHQPPLPSPASRLYFVLEGSGMLLSDRESMPLRAGYAYLAPMGIPCGFYGTPSLTKLFFHINVILPDGYDIFADASHFVAIPVEQKRLEALKDLYFARDAVAHVRLKAAVWEIIAAAIDASRPERRREAYSPRVADAIAFIRSNLSAARTVKEVACAVFCSETVLESAFRRELGTTVGRYMEDLLFFEARRMLLLGEESIGAISASLGFSDQFYFSRRFRKHFSMSPSEYRKARAGT